MVLQAYTVWGECVNSTPSKLPNVVTKQRGRSAVSIFRYLYAISDQASRFKLDAQAVAEATGFSRKTVYQVIAFLKRVNLLWTIRYRTGRGQHSTYQLNWRKPKSVTSPRTPRSKTKTAINDPGSDHGNQSERQTGRTANQPPTDAEIDSKLERVRNLVRAERANPAKRLMLMTLRWTAWSAGLSRGEQQALAQAAGKIVWPEPLRYAWEAIRELIRAVRSVIWFEELRSWLRWVRDTKGKCEALRACFAYLLKRLRAKVEAERAFDAEWVDAEVTNEPSEVDPDLSIWAVAFEDLHGRPPTSAERSDALERLASFQGRGEIRHISDGGYAHVNW